MTYKLTNFIFTRMFKMTIRVYLLLFVLEALLFYGERHTGAYYRFEQMLEKAGVGTIFLLSYILILIIYTAVLSGFYTGSKGIYRLVSLPIGPGKLLFALVFPCVVNIFILFCVQCMTVFLLGNWYHLYVQNPMRDYLLLAFIRYKPISILFPIGLLQIIRTLLLVISPAVCVVFAFFSATARKYANFSLTAIWVLLIIIFYNNQISNSSIVLSICLLLLSILMACLSAKYIKRRVAV